MGIINWIMRKPVENRKNQRFNSVAKILIPKVFSGEAVLKDISITGCRMEYAKPIEIQENTQYTMTIFPEENTEIGCFDLLVECRWINQENNSWDVGFDIKKSPGKRDFERYVDYLAWRHNT